MRSADFGCRIFHFQKNVIFIFFMSEKFPQKKSKSALSKQPQKPSRIKTQRYTPKLLKKINPKQPQTPSPQTIILKMKDLFLIMK